MGRRDSSKQTSVVAVCVQQVALRGAGSDGLVCMLSADLHQLRAEFAQQFHGNLLSIDVAAGAAFGCDDTADLALG